MTRIIFKTIIFSLILASVFLSCKQKSKLLQGQNTMKEVTAKDILGNKNYKAISYGGYRMISRDSQPTMAQLKDDMRLLEAMDIKLLRTYNVHLPHATNLLKAIESLKKEDPSFEMYVMLGAWIDCKNAWTGQPVDHNAESPRNEKEIEKAVQLAKQYPDIVKIIAVGNEAMVRWATSYYVEPWIVLKWVTHLQNLKKEGTLPESLWITSSDDFSSWGGGDASYHTADLVNIIKAVDYISMHTYPYHNSHYNPQFWEVPESEQDLSAIEKVNNAMLRANRFAVKQYDSVQSYMKSLGINKPIHIGETGWATVSNGHYGKDGSCASDEYKQDLYYKHLRAWTDQAGISCFYFEAFDEQWKDAANPQGSENHFGLITLNGEAKYSLWDLVDQGAFDGLQRDGHTITKTYNGDKAALMKSVLVPNTEYAR